MFKGTGGGAGLTTMLELWNDEKLENYNIDIDTYDHTNMSERPSIILDFYCTQQTPYLTVIYLMDKACGYLLASKHDPLKCERGEPGMDDSVVSVVTSATLSPQRGVCQGTGLDDMIQTVVNYCTKVDDKKRRMR